MPTKKRHEALNDAPYCFSLIEGDAPREVGLKHPDPDRGQHPNLYYSYWSRNSWPRSRWASRRGSRCMCLDGSEVHRRRSRLSWHVSRNALDHDFTEETISCSSRRKNRATKIAKRRNYAFPVRAATLVVTADTTPKERKEEIPYKRACEGHRVHSGYTIL